MRLHLRCWPEGRRAVSLRDIGRCAAEPQHLVIHGSLEKSKRILGVANQIGLDFLIVMVWLDSRWALESFYADITNSALATVPKLVRHLLTVTGDGSTNEQFYRHKMLRTGPTSRQLDSENMLLPGLTHDPGLSERICRDRHSMTAGICCRDLMPLGYHTMGV